MENDSGDRSIQVQDGENNDSREKSPIPVSQERHRNEEKDSLANRKQESQSRVTKRKKKSRKRKVSTSEETRKRKFLPAKKKKKANIGDIINRHCHLPQLPAIQVPMRNHIMTGLKLSPKMKILNGNCPKVWPITQTNILKSTFQRTV